MSNKVDLTATVQKKLGISKAESERISKAVIESMKLLIKKSKSLQLIGFGTFKVVTRKARMGVNPKTRARIKIKASKGVKFVVGKALKSAV